MECIAEQLPLISECKSNSIDFSYCRESISTYDQPFEDFPTIPHSESNELEEAKKTLGSLAALFSDEEFKVVITEIKYLSQTWVDEFERKIYKGKTLLQLLKEATI